MTREIPKYCEKAYALLYIKHKDSKFKQDSLSWLVSIPMRKKIFSILLKSGWIKKVSKQEYKCQTPEVVFRGIFNEKVPQLLKEAKKPYSYTGMNAVEIYSDFTYIQRSWEHSPYFIKVLKKDLNYWKKYLTVPYYIKNGTTIGEFIILMPVNELDYNIYEEYPVDKLNKVKEYCKNNEMFELPLKYINNKFNENAG